MNLRILHNNEPDTEYPTGISRYTLALCAPGRTSTVHKLTNRLVQQPCLLLDGTYGMLIQSAVEKRVES